MKYFMLELGCAMNRADGERIASVLEAMGFSLAQREEDAQILGVVACSVRQKAIDRVYSRISKWNDWKSERHLLTFVSGCILEDDHEKFLHRFDLVFSINELAQLPDIIANYGVPMQQFLSPNLPEQDSRPSGPAWLTKSTGPSLIPGAKPTKVQGPRQLETVRMRKIASVEALHAMQETLAASGGPSAVKPILGEADKSLLGGFWDVKPQYHSKFEAHIPIQNGCDKFCTYCAVPFTRGKEVSRPSQSILEEIASLLDQDFKSITLLGQNVNSYGRDRLDELSFAELLETIAELGLKRNKEFWLYFTSPHPMDMNSRVFEIMKKYNCIAKQLHLPLQSGSDTVLKRMNRTHDLAQYRTIVSEFRKQLPEASLFTDIIVGFTNESDEEFAATLACIEEFEFTMTYAALYSPRPGAESSHWEDDVPLETKKSRLVELNIVLHKTAAKYSHKLIGKTCKVLVQGYDRNTKFLSGHNENRIIVRFPAPTVDTDKLIGNFVNVMVTSATAMSVEGYLV